MGGGSGPGGNPRYIPLNLRTSDGDTVDTVIEQTNSIHVDMNETNQDVKPIIVSSDGRSFMNVTLGQATFGGQEIKFFNYTDAVPALEFTQYPATEIFVTFVNPILENRGKGWKLTTAFGSVQVINWQGNTFTLNPGFVYYVGYGSDGKPIITTTEADLVELANTDTRVTQFLAQSSPDDTIRKEKSFSRICGAK